MCLVLKTGSSFLPWVRSWNNITFLHFLNSIFNDSRCKDPILSAGMQEGRVAINVSQRWQLWMGSECDSTRRWVKMSAQCMIWHLVSQDNSCRESTDWLKKTKKDPPYFSIIRCSVHCPKKVVLQSDLSFAEAAFTLVTLSWLTFDGWMLLCTAAALKSSRGLLMSFFQCFCNHSSITLALTGSLILSKVTISPLESSEIILISQYYIQCLWGLSRSTKKMRETSWETVQRQIIPLLGRLGSFLADCKHIAV